jgi:uncharacterized protein (TIGR02391 family)
LIIKLDGTLSEIFGLNSAEMKRTKVSTFDFSFNTVRMVPPPRHELVRAFQAGQQRAISRIKATIELLSERLEPSNVGGTSNAIRAYEGLALHPEIERAASNLYRNGHYANAIEDAVKALNSLVRLRSGIELDGSTLMERVFSPSNPILKFNDLANQSGKDEQKGYMMLFSGAVSGLRNPRAHAILQDDPERALEFIAFVSLLAKLLDQATKV